MNPTPLFASDGSLAPLAASTPLYLEAFLPYYSHRWFPYRGLVSGHHKFIRGKGVELYDLDANPEETNNLAASETALVKRLERELSTLLATHSDLAWAAEQVLEGADLKALEALGYTGGTAGGDPFDTSLPDPRDRVAGQKELGRARALMVRSNELSIPSHPGAANEANLEQGRELLLEAQTILERLEQDYAGDPQVQRSLGEVKFGLGDFQGALPYFEQAAAEPPDSVSTLFSLGVCYIQTGETDLALDHVRRARRLDPKFAQAYMFLAWHDRERGEYGKAAGWMQALLAQLEPGDPTRAQVEHDLRLLETLMKEHGQASSPPE